MQFKFSPIPLLLTFATVFGVLVHDMHIDRATTLSLALPAFVASVGAMDTLMKSSDHMHTERVMMQKNFNPIRSSLPNIQPRDDDRRYIQNKKVVVSGGDTASPFWPSV